MWIMVAGPYRAGSVDLQIWNERLKQLNVAAYELFRRGHVPIIGVNMALPIIEAAGHDRYEEVMMPLSLALAEKCDAVLRIGGPSTGADKEVECFRRRGLPIFHTVDEIPDP